MSQEKAEGLPSYIGSKVVKDVENQGELVLVTFEDGNTITISEELLGMIVSSEPREGEVMDAIRHVLSTKFLKEMASYGLSYYMVTHIASGMETLAHNVRESAISERFGCKSVLEMPLSDII